MMKKIITISREYGSGGREIGRRLAEELGVPFYEKNLIDKVAKETGLSEKYVESQGEYAPQKNIFAYAFVGRDSEGSSVGDRLYNAQTKIIRQIAEEGSCVIVGRCADYILRDRKDCVHVFIHGEKEVKCKRIMELYHLTKEEAIREMHSMDKKRAINYNYYTEQNWGKVDNYTITLNSSELGYEKCIQLIKLCME
ncbi:MAG: cytidylate kinase-like family protein [Lachnospiraceae bacterium]|nr:cytidylate kinase-like family protein [Lachnospiraceae bacterium]